MKIKTVVIGLGKQSVEDNLPTLIRNSKFELLGVYDINEQNRALQAKKYSVRAFSSIPQILEAKPTLAILSLPHNEYVSYIEKLACAGIHIIKEKPFATSFDEAIKIYNLVKDNIFLGVNLQRRFHPAYIKFSNELSKIGKPFSIEGRYTMNLDGSNMGWRAIQELAGGGVLIDMGYHLIDLLVWYFGVPRTVTARITRGNRPNEKYNVEDTVNILFDKYEPSGTHETKTIGDLLISRVYPSKEETFAFNGVQGTLKFQMKSGEAKIELSPSGQSEFKASNNETFSFASNKQMVLDDQLEFFANQILDDKRLNWNDFLQHFYHIAVIDAAYNSDKHSISCNVLDFMTEALNHNLDSGELLSKLLGNS